MPPIGAEIELEDLELDPHPTLARLRASHPVAWIDVLGGWLVTSYEAAIRVMRDPDRFTVDDPRFSTSQVVGPSMLSLDRAEHVRHRQPFVAPFRAPAVQARFAEAVDREAEALIDAFAPSGSAELRRAFAGPLAAAIITRALGLPRSEVDSVLGWYDSIVAAVTEITSGRAQPNPGVQAFRTLRVRLEEVIDSANASSLLAVAAAGSSLSRDELVSNAAVLLFGGIETTEGMIANAALALLEHPEDLCRVRRHPELLDAALEESLRLEPAAAVIDRYAAADAELAGIEIAAGDLVRVSIAAANRDPAVFRDPDRFELHRPPGKGHVAFAQGPHVCVGVHLARLEARTGLSRLFAGLAELRLDPARPAKVRGLVFRKPPELHVQWG